MKLSIALHALFICCSVSAHFSTSLGILGNETYRIALLALQSQIIEDPFNVLSSWNDSRHFCEWGGIICSHRHQRVTVLRLTGKSLVGKISLHIGNLSFLRSLHLLENNLQGEIPQELGNLFRLEVLRLQNNSFIGKIPHNISFCSNLIGLDLSGNHLFGSIPMEFWSLPKLRYLRLENANLTGEIPPSLGNTTSLRVRANMNAFVGDFGIAKFLWKTENSANENKASSISLRGTIGYIPPEYGMRAEVSTQGDMYSYGILLLEIFTGKRPSDHHLEDGASLHDLCKTGLVQGLMDIIIDMRILAEETYYENANLGNQMRECLSSVTRIGVACSMVVETERMVIKDVVKELLALKLKLHPILNSS